MNRLPTILALHRAGLIPVSGLNHFQFQMEDPKHEVLRILAGRESTDGTVTLDSLKLRYFTWRELANLLGFPKNGNPQKGFQRFDKPSDITSKQMYRALGNSVSIYAVVVLLRRLVDRL